MTDQELHVAIDRLTKRLAELEGFDAKAMTERRPPNLVALETAITVALGRAFGENTADFKRYQGAGQLSWNPPIGPLVIGAPARPPTPLSSYQQGVESNIAKARALLSGAIQVLKEDFGERESPAVPAAGAVFTHALSKVFVVHGHDVGAREAVARFLEKIGLEAIILQEQANRGMTIMGVR